MLITAIAVKWKNLESCMPEVARTVKANQLLCGRGVPCKDEGFEKGSFLKKPVLLTMLHFLSFIAEMYEYMFCMNH